MLPVREEELSVFADFHQFYLWDSGVDPKAPEDWSNEDVSNMVKQTKNVLVVCPIRNVSVPVRISLFETRPLFNLDRYDHVVLGSLELPSGQLQLHESTGQSVLEWKLDPGTYGVLVLFSGLRSTSANNLEGQDQYHVVLWPGLIKSLEVLKNWNA